MTDFASEVRERIAANGGDSKLKEAAAAFMEASIAARYSYNFSWLGRPVIQYPQDMVAVQELVWRVRPDLIIETGIAHGGSLVLSASMLALLDYCDAARSGETLDPRAARRRVVGVDIEIRPHNRAALETHPLRHRMELIEGSSIAPDVVERVRALAAEHETVMVFLDSNHAHDHVLAELRAYAPLVSTGSFCVVFDTVVEDLPARLVGNRPWGRGDNPKTAVHAFLAENADFEIDREMENKLMITVAPDGYLRRVR